LLIAGKGGERYQEIMGIQYDYDERFVVRDILQKIGAE
jgi:UDP-N-acetylmuramyl tripeptide synthase